VKKIWLFRLIKFYLIYTLFKLTAFFGLMALAVLLTLLAEYHHYLWLTAIILAFVLSWPIYLILIGLRDKDFKPGLVQRLVTLSAIVAMIFITPLTIAMTALTVLSALLATSVLRIKPTDQPL